MYIELACMGRQTGVDGWNSDQKYTYFLGLGTCQALSDGGSQGFDSAITDHWFGICLRCGP